LIAGLVLLIGRLWPTPALASDWGTVQLSGATWHGVDVFYNGTDWTYTVNDSGYGYQWQCVELVQRFYKQVIWSGYDTHWPRIADAFQMFDDPDKDIQPLANGSARQPVWGDVLVFDRQEDWPSGHVAIVSRVANGRVYFVQQNVAQIASDSLPVDTQNHIGRDGASGVQYPPVRGWLHSPRNGGYATVNLGGYVVNARNGAAVPGALVVLDAGTPGGARVTTTDSSGWYWFAAVPQGELSVRALAPGFDSAANHVSLRSNALAYAPMLELQSSS